VVQKMLLSLNLKLSRNYSRDYFFRDFFGWAKLSGESRELRIVCLKRYRPMQTTSASFVTKVLCFTKLKSVSRLL
jgi:hypothetical protein